MGAIAGAVGALSEPREALLLSAQRELGQGTADASDDGLRMGLTATAAEAVRAAGTGSVVAGVGPRD